MSKSLYVAVTVESGKPMHIDWDAIYEFAEKWVCRKCGLRSLPRDGCGCGCGKNDWISNAEYLHKQSKAGTQ